jgi:hypothetical protein
MPEDAARTIRSPAPPCGLPVYTHLGEVLIKQKVRYTQKREETVMGTINKERMGYYRFWENKKATEEELKECAVRQRAEQ